MKSQSIQLVFITGLAVVLGFALSSSSASGYPATAVSYGNNPLWATAGQAGGFTTANVWTAPAEQDAVLTDLALDTNNNAHVWLRLDDGTAVGRYLVGTNSGRVNRTLESGITIPAGRTLQIQNENGYSLYWSVSGYYAKP